MIGVVVGAAEAEYAPAAPKPDRKLQVGQCPDCLGRGTTGDGQGKCGLCGGDGKLDQADIDHLNKQAFSAVLDGLQQLGAAVAERLQDSTAAGDSSRDSETANTPPATVVIPEPERRGGGPTVLSERDDVQGKFIDFGFDEQKAWASSLPMLIVFTKGPKVCAHCLLLEQLLDQPGAPLALDGIALVRISCPSIREQEYKLALPYSYPTLLGVSSDRKTQSRPIPRPTSLVELKLVAATVKSLKGAL